MEGETGKERRSVARICKEFLGPDWAELDDADVAVVTVEGGLTNRLFKCTHPSPTSVPNVVLVRLYNGDLGELCPRETDVMTFSILAERGIAPALYGAVAGVGRIEGWIENGGALKTLQLADPMLSSQIARAMARFHQQTLPLPKTDTWLFKALRSSLQAARDIKPHNAELEEAKEQLLGRPGIATCIPALQRALRQRDMPVVPCHNDLQEGNIMLTAAGELRLIDFEYTAYNYAAYDIANHFCEWTFCYDVKEHPNFWYDSSRYPTMEQQQTFVAAYLSARGLPDDASDVKAMVLDVVACSPVPHLLWAFWGIQNANSPIKFGYLEFAKARVEAYEDRLAVAQLLGPVSGSA